LDRNTRWELIERLVEKLDLTEDDIKWLEKEIEEKIEKELSMVKREGLGADERLP